MRAVLHAQQVPNGIGVLVPVQAVGGDAARVGFAIAVRSGEFILDVFDQGVDFRLLPGHVLGRHLPGPELLQDTLPAFPLVDQRRRIQKRPGIEAARRRLAAVTLGAIVFQNGSDGLEEGFVARRGNRPQDSSHANGEYPVYTPTHTLSPVHSFIWMLSQPELSRKVVIS